MLVPAALAAHYQQLLGLVKPWKITDINLDVAEQRLDITLEWPRGRKAPCPECGRPCGLKDHLPARTWRHLDSMQFKTFLHCRIPRSECRTHGARTIRVPWAEAGSQWTLLFEAFAVLVMERVASLTKAARLLGISWKEAHTLRKHAVRRGLERRTIEQIDYLGIDEKSFGKKERFITVLTDLAGERVLEVAPSKSSAAAKAVLAVICCDGQGAGGGAQETDGGRNSDLQTDAVPVPASTGALERETAGAVPGHQAGIWCDTVFPIADRANVGSQGVLPALLERCLGNLGRQVLPALVLLGDP